MEPRFKTTPGGLQALNGVEDLSYYSTTEVGAFNYPEEESPEEYQKRIARESAPQKTGSKKNGGSRQSNRYDLLFSPAEAIQSWKTFDAKFLNESSFKKIL
jgi:hypothetical protein